MKIIAMKTVAVDLERGDTITRMEFKSFDNDTPVYKIIDWGKHSVGNIIIEKDV